jgi:bifunctional non-homologous end joining protein LigD
VPTRRQVSLPLVTPIVPVLRDQPFDDPSYVFEPKYDGFRGLLYLSGQECHFRSKRGNVLKQFEQLCYWVREELRVKEAILDGEVVALDPEGRQDFRGLLARCGNLHYAAFDVLWLNGKDLCGLPLTRRKSALERVISATTAILSRVFAVESRGRGLFCAAERLDLEGIVAKRKADPYAPTIVWYKVKNRAYTQMEGRGELSQRYPTGAGSSRGEWTAPLHCRSAVHPPIAFARWRHAPPHGET